MATQAPVKIGCFIADASFLKNNYEWGEFFLQENERGLLNALGRVRGKATTRGRRDEMPSAEFVAQPRKK
jgi:hypothetical protein